MTKIVFQNIWFY